MSSWRMGPRLVGASSGDIQISFYGPHRERCSDGVRDLVVEVICPDGVLRLDHAQMIFLYGFLMWQIEGVGGRR